MTVLPTLSLDGFISNRSVIMRKVFIYFLTSDYSQSTLMYGNIASLKYLMLNTTKPNDLMSKIRTVLNKQYSIYFDNVDIMITESEPTENNIVKLGIEIIAMHDGVKYTLSENITGTLGSTDIYNEKTDVLYKDN